MNYDLFNTDEVHSIKPKSKRKSSSINRVFPYSRKEPLEILSLGFGVQSTCLAFMSAMNIIPSPDYVIFSGTKAEPEHLYRYIEYAKERNIYR